MEQLECGGSNVANGRIGSYKCQNSLTCESHELHVISDHIMCYYSPEDVYQKHKLQVTMVRMVAADVFVYTLSTSALMYVNFCMSRSKEFSGLKF